MTDGQHPGSPSTLAEPRIEAARRVLLADPVPWDDLRQRRALANIEARLDAAGADTGAGRGRGRVVAIVGAAVALAAAVVLLLWLGPLGAPDDAATSGIALGDVVDRGGDRDGIAIPYAKPASMALADGSVAELHDGARVEVGVQTAELVRLDQRSGTVRYEVAKNPRRSFVVDAGGVEVRVIGTVFTVGYAGDAHVEVSVERGLVEVVSADRVARLGAGDSLKVEVTAEPDEFVIIEDEGGDETV
ncbi:MAG: FecR family protein, partial [Myxococcota bacterium]